MTTTASTNIENNFILPAWPAPKHIKAYSSLRASGIGVRKHPLSPDDPAPGIADRELLKNLLSLPSEPVWLKQTHSTIVLKAVSQHRFLEGDASFTDEANIICAVMTADCLPVLFCDHAGTKVAAVHAGWRGLANGIVEKTVDALGVPADELLVWLGPAIGPKKFLVREDVVLAFTKDQPENGQAFTSISNEQWLGDLFAIARRKLENKGIKHIYGGEHCTFSDAERFYSYRRDGNTGRIISLIWIA